MSIIKDGYGEKTDIFVLASSNMYEDFHVRMFNDDGSLIALSAIFESLGIVGFSFLLPFDERKYYFDCPESKTKFIMRYL